MNALRSAADALAPTHAGAAKAHEMTMRTRAFIATPTGFGRHRSNHPATVPAERRDDARPWPRDSPAPIGERGEMPLKPGFRRPIRSRIRIARLANGGFDPQALPRSTRRPK